MSEVTLKELARRWGISHSYACEIVNHVRVPSRALALRIFVATGDKYGPLAGLSDEDAATLARIESAAA